MLQASCQACDSNPAAARVTAVTRTARSVSNQARTFCRSAGGSGSTPGPAGSISVGVWLGSISRGRRVRGVHVVVQDPPQRGRALGGGVDALGQLGGVGPDEVVVGAAARARLAQQVHRAELRDGRAGLVRVHTPARLAQAGTVTSGPGCSDSSRNILAVAAPSSQ